MAKILAKYDPMFIEETVLCENMERFKEIAACCNIPIALSACLQVDAASCNAAMQERSIGIHCNKDRSVLDYVLSKELAMEENRVPHHWKNPVWRHPDGSIAEWQKISYNARRAVCLSLKLELRAAACIFF